MAPLLGKGPKCKACGSELQPTAIDRMSGTAGRVEVTLFGMPGLACPQNHEKRYIDPDFGDELAGVVSGKIPKTSMKGFVSRRHSCSNCGAPLEPAVAQTGTVAIPLELRKGGPFRLEIRVPLLRCPSCDHEQVTQDLGLEIFEAMANAFIGANLRP